MFFAKRRWALHVTERMGLCSKETTWFIGKLVWAAKLVRKQSGWWSRKGVLKAASTMADNPSAIGAFRLDFDVDESVAFDFMLRARYAALELADEHEFYDLLAALKTLGISGPEKSAERVFNELLAAVKGLGISWDELAVKTESLECPPKLRYECIFALELAVKRKSFEYSTQAKKLGLQEPKLPAGYAFYNLLERLKHVDIEWPEEKANYAAWLRFLPKSIRLKKSPRISWTE